MVGSNGMRDMKAMMSKMMERGKQMGSQMMPEMMTEMMPKCLTKMLPNMPKKKRVAFVLKMVATLKEQGCVGMSTEEKEDFVEKIVESARD